MLTVRRCGFRIGEQNGDARRSCGPSGARRARVWAVRVEAATQETAAAAAMPATTALWTMRIITSADQLRRPTWWAYRRAPEMKSPTTLSTATAPPTAIQPTTAISTAAGTSRAASWAAPTTSIYRRCRRLGLTWIMASAAQSAACIRRFTPRCRSPIRTGSVGRRPSANFAYSILCSIAASTIAGRCRRCRRSRITTTTTGRRRSGRCPCRRRTADRRSTWTRHSNA